MHGLSLATTVAAANQNTNEQQADAQVLTNEQQAEEEGFSRAATGTCPYRISRIGGRLLVRMFSRHRYKIYVEKYNFYR